MTASTYYNRYLAPWHGRINHRWSWSARRSVRNQWLQVYFGVLARLTGIRSQGRQDANQWVKTFILTFSRDGFKFVKYPKVKCSPVIKGNNRSSTRGSSILYEMGLQGIMVVIFIILDRIFFLMNTTTMIPGPADTFHRANWPFVKFLYSPNEQKLCQHLLFCLFTTHPLTTASKYQF